jgi:hypothetical protein
MHNTKEFHIKDRAGNLTFCGVRCAMLETEQDRGNQSNQSEIDRAGRTKKS